MINKFYEEFFKTQNSMMDSWKGLFAPETEKEGENLTLADYFQQMAKLNQQMFLEMYNSPQKFMEKMQEVNPYDNNFLQMFNPDVSMWKNMMGANNMLFSNAFKSPEEIWNNLNYSFNAYNSAYNLYRSLVAENKLDPKSLNRAFDTWKDETTKYIKTYMIPMAPEKLRMPMNQYVDFANKGVDMATSVIAPWLDEKSLARDAFVKSIQEGPGVYFNYLVDMQKKMMDSINVMEDANQFGYSKEFYELQKKTVDKASKYNAALGNYYQRVYEVLSKASQRSIEEVQKAVMEGMEPKTFEEFYEFINQKSKEWVEKFIKADGFNKLLDQTMEAFAELKEESEELGKEYYAYMQIPRRMDIVKLEEKIESLNEKIESLNAEIANLKASK